MSNFHEIFEEHEQLQLRTARESSKSYPVIVSQSSFERDVINNVHRMSISDRQLSGERKQLSLELDDENVVIRDKNYNIGENKLDSNFFSRSLTSPGSSPKPLSSPGLAQSPNTNRQSVIKHSAPRMRMRRQDKIDEDDTRGLYASQSFDTANLHKSRDQFNQSHLLYSSLDSSAVPRRLTSEHSSGINFKSKSLDLHNDYRSFDPSLQYRPFHSSASDSISSRSSEDDVQIHINSSNANSANINSAGMYFHPQYFSDMYFKAESPHSLPSDIRIPEPPPLKVSDIPIQDNQLPPQDIAHYKAFKYAQKKAYSQNTHPYDRFNVVERLRRIYSEERISSFDSKGGKMRRSSSYNTLKDLNQTNKSPAKQDVKPTTKMMFPEDNNVSAYRNVFIKQSDATKQNDSISLPPNNAEFLNYLNRCTFQFNEEDKAKSATQKIPAKQKNTSKANDTALIPPYVYDRDVDDGLAVCVTGLLALPGSNEKRYPITVGELRRRISPPEYLNKVDMISYVRLAKTTARELLEKHAIRPKHHCRKSKHSIISKMCEAECTEFAKGLKKLTEEYFPYDWIAKKSLEASDEKMYREEERNLKMEKLKAARSVLKDLADVLDESKSDEVMQNYNLATHTYGFMDLSNNIGFIDNIIEKQMDLLGHNSMNSPPTSWRVPSHQESIPIKTMDT